MKRWMAIACAVGALALLDGRPGNAAEFRCSACDVKASEVERCWRMDPKDYSTAMFFNPPGMKALYKRSSCLQGLAVRYRDASLCEEVRERKSLFFDGSAISRASCEQRVQERARNDPKVVISDIHRLADVAYVRNGNGRDIDVRVGFSGSYQHRDELTVSMVDETGANIETLHRNDYWRGASTGALHIVVRQAKIAAAAEALALEPPYRFRVTLALVEPSLAEVRQFASLPRELRESSIERRIDPAKLERDISDLRL
jgi:hypothetical protein